MDINQFWEIVEIGKDSDEPEEILRKELEKLSPEEIVSFQERFDNLFDTAYRWNLWGAAYIIGGGCSDDGFTDFRYALISKGKEIYEAALNDPDSLSELGDNLEIDNEMYGYVARKVYETKKGCELPIDQNLRTTPNELEASMGEEWDFEDEIENKKRLPKLMQIYW